jgi:hypothetical protein
MGTPLAQIDILSAHKGHDKKSITIEEDSPKKRAKLAEHVVKLLKDGFLVCLADGRKVTGYDAPTNSWIIIAEKKEAKVPAQGNKANAVAPVAGG